MGIQWKEVTWYSKLFAVLFFILLLPAWTFYLGRLYESAIRSRTEEIQLDALESSKVYKNPTGVKLNTAQPGAVFSGILGISKMGPTCPVVREGDTTCNDKPFSTHIVIKNSKGSIVTETLSKNDGKFALELTPGSYIIEQAKKASPLPTLEPQVVTVPMGKVVSVTLNFDSGIR